MASNSGPKPRAGRSVSIQIGPVPALARRRRSVTRGVSKAKAMGGRSVKAFRRRGIRTSWRRTKSQEGRGVRMGLNRSSETVARVVGSKALEPSSGVLARSSGRRSFGGNGRRAAVGENPIRLCNDVGPLKGESCTWLWDGTSPQRTWWSKPSRVGGTPRTERSEELGAPCAEWTPCADVVMRNLATHRGALLVLIGLSGPGGS